MIDAGLRVTALREHTECEWQALRHLVEGPDGKFRLAEMPERLPLMFTLEAAASGVGPAGFAGSGRFRFASITGLQDRSLAVRDFRRSQRV